MIISHIELQKCLMHPREWVASKKNKESHGWSLGYSQALKLAIRHYHKTGSERSAREYLKEVIRRNKFKNKTRIDELLVDQDLYIKWHKESSTIVADSFVKINLGVGGFLELGGLIGRVDITTDGYQGILFGTPVPDWKTQLRIPLIQRALSEQYGRPLTEVAVGFQRLAGGESEVVTVPDGDVKEAERAFKALGERVRRLTQKPLR